MKTGFAFTGLFERWSARRNIQNKQLCHGNPRIYTLLSLRCVFFLFHLLFWFTKFCSLLQMILISASHYRKNKLSNGENPANRIQLQTKPGKELQWIKFAGDHWHTYQLLTSSLTLDDPSQCNWLNGLKFNWKIITTIHILLNDESSMIKQYWIMFEILTQGFCTQYRQNWPSNYREGSYSDRQ